MNNKIKVKINCRKPKVFLNEIIRNNINIYNIELYDNKLIIIIDNDSLEIVEKIKYIHKSEVIDYYGINKIINLIKKKRALIFYIIIGILINIFLSNIIFTIDIETPNKKLKQQILEDLSQQNIRKYHFKLPQKTIKKAKKIILTKEKDKIEWLEIESKGTKYIVKVEERKINKKDNKCRPRNIIARKNTVITKITSSSGEIIKHKNDYVEKGEVLISGFIHNKEKITSKKCAIGKVYGETWYKVSIDIPNYKTTKIKTKDSTYGLHYKILGNNYNIHNKYKTYQKKQYNIIDSDILPIKIGIAKYIKINYKKVKYSNKEINKIALSKSTKAIVNKYKNVKIIDKKILKKTQKNSKIRVDVFLVVEEEISAYQDISKIDIEKMNEEKEG